MNSFLLTQYTKIHIMTPDLCGGAVLMESTPSDRAFGTVELITSDTVVLSVKENSEGCPRREVLARANPHLDMSDLSVGDQVTLWPPRIEKGWKTEPRTNPTDRHTIYTLQKRGYRQTANKCLYCSGPTMKREIHETCIHCHKTQIRE